MGVGHYAKTKTVQIAEQKAPNKRQVEERATMANERAKDISSQAEKESVLSLQQLEVLCISLSSGNLKSSWNIQCDEIKVIEGKPIGVGGGVR